VDIADVVTPPEVTREVLADAAAAGIGIVWLQDGSFDDAVLEQARNAPFQTVHHACIMVVASAVSAERR
jgi:predicted CoA-binding protein